MIIDALGALDALDAFNCWCSAGSSWERSGFSHSSPASVRLLFASKVGSNRCSRFSCCEIGFGGAEDGEWDPVTGLGTLNYEVRALLVVIFAMSVVRVVRYSSHLTAEPPVGLTIIATVVPELGWV